MSALPTPTTGVTRSAVYAGAPGEVGLLNVGTGDIRLSFDPNNPAERIRAARVVKDMLRRGYALLVEHEINGVKGFRRALDFDENTYEYVIADLDPLAAAAADAEEPKHVQVQEERSSATAEPAANPPVAAPAPTPNKRGRKRVPVESARAVAVARTAGG